MRPYTVVGAGAVGSSLAAYLARRGHPVLAVGREAHVSAIRAQGGIRVRAREETFLAPVEAVTGLPGNLPKDAVLMLAVQAHHVPGILEEIAAPAATRPLITWQNGIRSEETAAARCPRVYGGVVRYTSTVLEPGEVRLRQPGLLIVGRHPFGTDALSAEVVADLNAAGFTAAESEDIRADKALKLLVNLISGPAVLIHRSGMDPSLARVQVALLEEGAKVLTAAGIPFDPRSGLGHPLERMLETFRHGGTRPDTTGGVYNSTWQNLHHRRERIENDAYHGEIVRLGREHGVQTPVNERVLEVLEEVHREGLGPEPFSPEEFREKFAGWVEFAEEGEEEEEEEGGLEI